MCTGMPNVVAKFAIELPSRFRHARSCDDLRKAALKCYYGLVYRALATGSLS